MRVFYNLNIIGIKRLQHFLKHVQEKENYEIGANLDYSSIDEDDYLNFTHDPFNCLKDGEDPRPVFSSSTPGKLLDYLESIGIEFKHSSLSFNGGPLLPRVSSKGPLRQHLNQSMFLSHPKKKIKILP